MEDLKESEKVVLESSVILICTVFEAFILDVLKKFYKMNLRKLIEMDEKKGKKTVSYREILDFKTLEELHSYIIQEVINDYTWSGIIGFFHKKLNINFEDSGVRISKINEIRETKNILVHKKGRIDERFLKQVKGCKYRVGDKI